MLKACITLALVGAVAAQEARPDRQQRRMADRPANDMFEEEGAGQGDGQRVERDGGGFHGHHAPVHHAPVHHAPVHHAPLLHRPPVHHAPIHHAPLVHAAPAYAPPVHHAPAPYVPPHAGVKLAPRPYAFQYGVADQYSGSQFQQQEAQTADGVVTGSYSVALPDGRVQHVNYHADHHGGYVAEVSYEGVAVYPDAPAGGYGHHAPAPHAPAYHAPAPVYRPGHHLAASRDDPVRVPAPVAAEPVLVPAQLPVYKSTIKHVTA